LRAYISEVAGKLVDDRGSQLDPRFVDEEFQTPQLGIRDGDVESRPWKERTTEVT
jgi:hypothetical protein